MSNYQETSGKIKKAKKVVLYGTEGIGKSTFASKFPNPLFIDTEGSTTELDVRRWPKPTSWEMLIDEVQNVIKERPCKTLVIDTADWAERLCIQSICSRYDKKGIEDFGYGNGYTYVAEEWGKFLNILQDVVDISNINVLLNAHACIRKFEQPNEMGAYDRYELKLGKKTTAQTAPITKEWADMVLFANYKTFSVAVDDKGKKHKAQGGQRVMYTTHHPCWDAKNRFNLPDECPFDYEVIRHILEDNISMDDVITTQAIAEDPYEHNEFVDAIQTQEPLVQPQSSQVQIDPRIPKQLQDLMIANKVSEDEIETAVASRGYFPYGMPVADYPADFIEGVLVGAWQQVYKMIIDLRKDVHF